MNRQSLFFTAPQRIELCEEPRPTPKAGQVLVQTLYSAISAGTELLLYRGQAPEQLAADETLAALSGSLKFPLKYGYSAVGRVIALGKEIEAAQWQGRLVFAFNPHETYFVANPADLIELPPELDPVAATFLANMETAVNFLHDGAPRLGERVAVFGQGMVGLLTTALLAHLPLAELLSLDPYPLRRSLALQAGAHQAVDPQTLTCPADFDLCYELSGSPAALDQALNLTGFGGRIVLGSWYGTKRVALDLGRHFHRSRIKLIGSQVSSVAPELTGRWTKARRLQTALHLLSQVNPARWITHRFPFAAAAQAYELLDQKPEEAGQVILTYAD